ncbi:PEP-CTERM sorting domain-containing protein [Bryobacter aggregatus]|uniref:PEP-CTERM sorting domain-containing protein n=1 Tax=Bryobacter aggregatus TaxID=360054 RepID=UPI0006909992|nr:PEP-CTERM sorting domain-containing protein [Bryobacter aggregatus]
MRYLSLPILYLALACQLASAGTLVINDTTTGAPTWKRPFELGTYVESFQVRFHVLEFSVSQSGSYSFNETATWDNYTFLYQNSFDPSAPLTNFMIGNDDSNIASEGSGFNQSLVAGVNYFFISTGFNVNHYGAFTLTIDGPGEISLSPAAVPEPSTFAMGAVGAGLLVWLRRRR